MADNADYTGDTEASVLMHRLPLWALGTILVGCTSEGGFTRFDPQLVVLPASLAFEDAVANEEVLIEALNLENAGLATLDVTGMTVDGGGGAFAVSFEPVSVEPGDSVQVPVSFAPDALGDFEATVVVASNDPDGDTEVIVSGTGRDPRLPDIFVDLDGCLDFGDVEVGTEAAAFFDVRNIGEADLLIGSMAQTGSGAFTFTDQSGSVLSPDGSELVVVSYLPRLTDQGDSAILQLPSNDPDEPVFEVCLEGNGGGDYDYPVADIACPGEVPFVGPTDLVLDGSGSFDPNGAPLSYAWSIVRRPSAASPDLTLVPEDAAMASLALGTAGLWEVSLTVTADSPFGPLSSVPAKCVIDAVPTDAVFVELSWNGLTSDFDLHVAESTAGFYDVPGDCSWCNANPDWGVTGASDDDPVHGGDVQADGGPEYITMPLPADGAYVVRVHHFDDGVDGRTTANVQVFVAGALVWDGAKVLERNEIWEVGQVNWPDGTFGAYTSPPFDAGGTRECE